MPAELAQVGMDVAALSSAKLHNAVPQMPPGPYWDEYEYGDVIWYYYEGPLGTWWYDKDMTEPKPYCNRSGVAATPVQVSGDAEKAKSTAMTEVNNEPVKLAHVGVDETALSSAKLHNDVPQKPPGPYWDEYEYGDVIWYYYEGPLGTWWYDKDMTEPKPYCNSSVAAEPVQVSGDAETATSTAMTDVKNEPVELAHVGVDVAALSSAKLHNDVPQKPPGPYWDEYEYGDVTWYYYEGPLGTWWYDKDMTEPKPYCNSSVAAKLVQVSGDVEKEKSTAMTKMSLPMPKPKPKPKPAQQTPQTPQTSTCPSTPQTHAQAPQTPPPAATSGAPAWYTFTPSVKQPALTKTQKKELKEKEAAEKALAQKAEQALADAKGRIEDCVLVFYDFETTGLDWRIEGITEIAAQRIHYKDGRWVRDGESLEFFVNPGKPVPKFITQLTGITNDMVRDAVSLEEGLAILQAYIAASAPRPTIPMAHNGKGYDRHFVRCRWPRIRRGEFNPPNVEYWGDSISLFKLLSPGRFQKYKLGMLYESLNGPPSNAHRALADVRMMEYCINALWSSRVGSFDSRLGTLHRLASTKKGAPPEAKLQNSTLFELDEE